jgi:type IV pilus assembly protein PilM
MIFTAKQAYPVGLDISDLSIKLIQLNKSKGKIKIQALGRIDIEKGIIEKGEVKDKTKLIIAIKKIMAEPLYGKVTSEEIVACLPESKTFVKLIALEPTPNPIENIIETEIEKHIPLPLNQMYFDWQTVSPRKDNQHILIGAAPKDIVNQYTELIDEAKLAMSALEIEPIAICRSVLPEEKPGFDINKGQNYAILDIGASHTNMIFYSKDALLFSISLPLSGTEITNEISTTLKITAEQAEKAKIICGLDEAKADGVVKKILAQTTSNLLDKIKNSIEYYNSQFPSFGPINKISIVGGGANICDITNIIEKETSISTIIANPFVNLSETKDDFLNNLEKKSAPDSNKKISQSMLLPKNIYSSFATAIGLALRGIFVDETN